MKNKTILVTGIGGNVGQGILRNIIAEKFPVRLVGTNIEKVSSGNHLCDAVYLVPWGNEPGYMEKLTEICRKEKVDLIIPSTDYESYMLTLNRKLLPVIASSPAKFNTMCLDKYLTWQAFTKAGIPFAQSALPSAYDGQFGEIILKPRQGRGSRGIIINPENPSQYADTYVVQKRYVGTEITTAFYVTKKGKVLSSITFERELYSGLTGRCQVSSKYDERMNAIIGAVVRNFTVRGSCNIQSIVTPDGDILPFELNSRISGTNSIRSNFGFPDVRWTVEEFLFRKTPKAEPIRSGSAIRIIMDVIYPDVPLSDVENSSTEHRIF